MATVHQIAKKVDSGELMAIPVDHLATFIGQCTLHLERDRWFRLKVVGEKILIGPSELECGGWQIENIGKD